MAEYSTPEQRTELPTERRLSQLRREGQIHLSFELAQVVTLLAGFFALKFLWGTFYDDMRLVLVKCFTMVGDPEPFTAKSLHSLFVYLLILVGPAMLILMLVLATVATLSVMLQTNWNIREKKIKFRWDMIHPMEGIKRIFSVMGLMNTLKSIAKLALILPIAYFALRGFSGQLVMLIHTSIPELLNFTGLGLSKLFWRIMYVLMALAIFDYFWGRFQWYKHNKMTKDEVEDERKSVEGDEETRRRIQWKGIQRVIQRIKNSVRQADVVITNPTHYAIALQYDRKSMSAPIVLAKGRDHMALHIREMAKEAGVPIVERKWLARALYSSVEVGKTIPYQLFKAVAEVLAYVYKLRSRNAGTAQAAAR